MKSPAVNIDLTGVLVLAGVVILGALGLYVYKQRAAIAQGLNPASDKNIAYQGVNAAGAAITGNKDFSLGSWLYDLTHKASDINSPVVIPDNGANLPRDAVAAGVAL